MAAWFASRHDPPIGPGSAGVRRRVVSGGYEAGMEKFVNHKTRGACREGRWEASHVRASMLPGAATRAGGGGHAEIVFERSAVRLERGAVALVHHHAALEDHRPVGHAQDL